MNENVAFMTMFAKLAHDQIEEEGDKDYAWFLSSDRTTVARFISQKTASRMTALQKDDVDFFNGNPSELMAMVVEDDSVALINFFGIELMNRAQNTPHLVDAALPFLCLGNRLPVRAKKVQEALAETVCKLRATEPDLGVKRMLARLRDGGHEIEGAKELREILRSVTACSPAQEPRN